MAYHRDFRPNLTPYEMFARGSFGGTYWRPIKSRVTKRNHRNRHAKFAWAKQGIFADGARRDLLTQQWTDYDTSLNRFGVRVGTTLRFWEGKGWITAADPYGWVEWYCNYAAGRRLRDEDARQIDRWLGIAGPRGRFRLWLITLVEKKGRRPDGSWPWDDESISPKIRQTLQHWGYRLTKADFDAEMARRRKKK